VEIAQKPERHLVDDFTVPFVLGDVVDGFVFDAHSLNAARPIWYDWLIRLTDN
jgi:hypothetical protein